jgi:hypothetical protein
MKEQQPIDITIKGIKQDNILLLAVLLIEPEHVERRSWLHLAIEKSPTYEFVVGQLDKVESDADYFCKKGPMCEDCQARREFYPVIKQLIKAYFDAKQKAKEQNEETIVE